MNISKKIFLSSVTPLLVLGCVTLVASMYSVNRLGQEEVEQRATMLHQEQEGKLQDSVRSNIMATLQTQYRAAIDPEKVAARYLPELKGVIQTAVSTLEAVQSRTDLDEAAKKELALSLIAEIRYGKSGYIWINDTKPLMSLGLQEINENVSQSSAVAQEIASDISGVNEVSTSIKGDADWVRDNADDMGILSERLPALVHSFKV